MSHATMPDPAMDPLNHDLASRLTTVVQHLTEWMTQTTPDLQQLEEHVLRALKELGGVLLVGLAQRFVPADPPPTHPCPCGATAIVQRLRPATCRTVLGSLAVTRPYYLCAPCHQGCAPFDHLLGWCAGGRSAGLNELLALLGATQDSFAEAASVLGRLTYVEVAPNTVRAATEHLGSVVAAHEHAQVTTLQTGGLLRSEEPSTDGPLCVSLDGVQAHLTPEGGKELCVGAVYHVRPCRPSQQRHADAVQAQNITYVAELGSQREAFGWHLYAEAQRRGADRGDIAVVGDGAAWLWTLADLHFPQATQILDWVHATEYVWSAATALWGEGTAARTAWAEGQLEQLWAGRVDAVLATLARSRDREEVRTAHTYFTNQQARMDYPTYRARGLPIGSGTVESGCKQVVSSRLKGAGMIWTAEGARQVAKVRAWLKGGRWQEAMALRGRPQRQVRVRPADRAARELATACAGKRADRSGAGATSLAGVPPEVLATIRAELTQTAHPWRRAWSREQQRRAVDAPVVQPAPLSSA